MTKRSTKNDAQQLIQSLTNGRVRATCPTCDESFALARAGLFFSTEFTPAAKRALAARKGELAARRAELRTRPTQIVEASVRQAGATNLGFILERIATTLPTFPLKSSECRSLFDPIDYVAFPGAGSGRVESIHFVEIKSGRSKLTPRQKEISEVVERGRVSLETYTVESRP